MESKGQLLLRTLVRYAQILEAYRDRIDRLNVYPVPDGDTGTNMFFTVRAAIEVIESKQLEHRGDSLSGDDFKDIAKGALLGARGNSGVILSQIISSFCSVFGKNPLEELLKSHIKDAFNLASKSARAAVLNPVEGTILTVLADVALLATKKFGSDSEVTNLVQQLFDRSQSSLENTPELLPQLKKAKVVDSGGAGLVLFIAAMCIALGSERFSWGSKMPFLFEASVPEATRIDYGSNVSEVNTQGNTASGPRYEVMFIVESNDRSIRGFRDVWAGLGDSIVVVGQDSLYNCHIHTDDIGASIEAGIAAGLVSRIRVTDLIEQIREERWVLEAHGAGAPNPDSVEFVGEVETAVVVIANGDGVRRIFRSLGVHRIVLGGQSMNPSTEDILRALEEVPSNNVIVLPNNTNVTPVAQLASEISTKTVRIIPTKGVIEGMSALVEFDPMVGIDENFDRMSSCAKSVRVAEVTRAVRDYESEIGQVRVGDYIGLSRTGVVSVSISLVVAVLGAISALIDDDVEILTIIEGEGSSPASTREITEEISHQYAHLQVEIHHGAQPLYPYLIGIE